MHFYTARALTNSSFFYFRPTLTDLPDTGANDVLADMKTGAPKQLDLDICVRWVMKVYRNLYWSTVKSRKGWRQIR